MATAIIGSFLRAINSLRYDLRHLQDSSPKQRLLFLIEHIEKPSALSILEQAPCPERSVKGTSNASAACSRLARVQRGSVIWLNGAKTDFFGIGGEGFVKTLKTRPAATI